jgi:phosphomannomutase
MDLLKLQNGSDIRGVASEGVEGEIVNLTSVRVWKIAASFSEILSKRLGKKVKISLGRDSRISGKELLEAAAAGIDLGGCTSVDFGIATTPAMFMSIMDEELDVDGAIMVTASHLPFNRNGMKFFMKEGGADKKLIKEILENAEKYNYTDKYQLYYQSEKIDFIVKYAKGLRDYITEKTGMEKPLAGTKIIVDAGNGAGGFFAAEFLEKLGADTTGSLYLDPDGMFPNHVPNPEDKTALEIIKKQVVDVKANLGIIFDTDVDRSAIIDSEGNAVNRNRLIALISAILLKEHPESYIVTDSVTSKGLKEFIENRGGVHHRFQRGYKNVINESIRLNEEGYESYIGIETSGHGALKENYFLDDGAFLVVKVLTEYANMKKIGSDIFDLIKDYEDPAEENEIRIKIAREDFQDYGKRIIIDIKEKSEEMEGWSVEKPNYEGVRINCDVDNGNGWFLLRMSLHDPVLPLNIESDSIGGCNIIEKRLFELLGEYMDLKY